MVLSKIRNNLERTEKLENCKKKRKLKRKIKLVNFECNLSDIELIKWCPEHGSEREKTIQQRST